MKHTIFLRFIASFIVLLPLRGLGGFVFAQTTPEIETRVQIGHTSIINEILLLPDNKTFLTVTLDGRVNHWDLSTGKEIRSFQVFIGDINKVNKLLLLRDKKTILAASPGNTIKQWDLESGKEIQTFQGHTGDVHQILLLPDNKTFLTGSRDKTAKQWDLATGKEIRTFQGHTDWIEQLLLLPDNKTFLTVSKDSTVKHWDLTTGKEIHTFAGHTDRIWEILLLPNNKTFVTASRNGILKQWDLATGKEIHTFTGHTDRVYQILLLPDNKSFLTASWDNTVKHWDLASGKEIHSFQGQSHPTLLSNNTTFLTASRDTIKHWDLASGKEIQSFQGHTSNVWEILLLPDNKTFVTGSSDGTVKHWDITTGKEIRTFAGHTGSISEIFFSSHSKTFLTAGNDKTVRYWDWETGKELRIFKGHTDTVYETLLLSDNQTCLIRNGEKTVKQWDLATGKGIHTFQGHTGNIWEILPLPDNKTFLTASTDSNIKHWNLVTSEEIRTFQGHTAEVYGILLSADNKTFLTASNDQTVKHWDLVSGEEIRSFQGQLYPTLLPDNKTFLTASKDSTVKYWDLTTGREIHTFRGHKSNVFEILLLSDNQSFLTNSWDNTVKHWNLVTGKEIHTFQGHTDRIWDIILLPDNQTFLTISSDKTVKHWNLVTGKELHTFTGVGSRILLLPNNKSFLTASYDNTVKHWDLASGKEIRTFVGHTSGVYQILLSPDNKSFLSTSDDNTIKHWDLTSGKELGTFHSRYGEMFSIHFLPDSSRFITVNRQNSLTLWDFKTYKEIATLIPVAGDNQDYVVISPDGRFDGTPAGMDKLVHFVVGNEIIELSQLKERFYTPDLWKTLLTAPEKLGTVENLKEIRLYPEMKIKGKDNTLTINLKPRSGGIGKVNVYINGREVNESKTDSSDFNPQRKTQIQLNLKNYQSYFKEGKNTISVKAYHEEGWLASRFQHITYQKGSLQSRDTTSKAKPEGLQEDEIIDFDANITESKAVGDFYALCIGTSDYVGEGIKDLTFPTSDAQSMAEALKIGAKKFFVDEDEPNKNKIFIRTLTTDDKNPLNQPSKDNIRRVFGEIASKAKAEDMFVVFFAGHGTTFKKDNELFELFYYLTKDAGSRSVMQDALRKSHTISSDELIAWLKEIKAGKQVMILDACHSGQAVDNIFAQRDIPPSQKRALELMKDRTGLYIISGSAADAVSYESSEYGQGFLTYSLLMGMTGAALDKETSHLNVGTWFKYASNEVNRMAAEYNSTQQPQVAEPKNNFWIGKFEEKDRNLIPLKEAKPMFGEPIFLNGDKLRDDLGLMKLVKSELVEGLYNARSANYIFTDSDSKKIHQINGLYTIDAQGNIKITLKIYKGDDLKAEIKDMEGNVKEIKDLAEMIVSEAKKRVVK